MMTDTRSPQERREAAEQQAAAEFAEYRSRWWEMAICCAFSPFDWEKPYKDRDGLDGTFNVGFGPLHFSLMLPWTRKRRPA